MPSDQRTKLVNIKRFDQLIAYLRDEMLWPIDSGSEFEALTFEYTSEELGIDAKNAAKILEIKRLRPLIPKQPWGIFFVKFESKRVETGVLRSVLGRVAIKRRATPNGGDRQTWAADDLLFISAFGAEDERRMVFAHFSQPPSREDRPVLKVVDWNHLNTAFHIDDVARRLTQSLAWPEKPVAADEWRRRWQSAFDLRPRQSIETSKQLAIRLAELARDIRDRIKTVIAIETENGPLTKLMRTFQAALVQDLDADGFADMYAQTIAYGLLSARIADPTSKPADDLAAHMRTSPFLRELMEHFLRVGGRRGKAGGPGIDFDELGVRDVEELLDDPDTHMDAVFRDFGDKNRNEDPVIHFYEHFLAAYNKKLKVQRGVFYTPQPVVSYIVRSVHELLQTEFGLADGLADTTTWGEMVARHPGLKLPPLTDEAGEERTIAPDEPFVQILDPATGTATFLVEVIDVIHRTLLAKWTQQGFSEAQQLTAWNDYVPRHLLPRLHAYELMMAPYAIAHMKVGLKLAETGYQFASEVRARVYLTNALEPWVRNPKFPEFEALANEAAAVNEIKRHKRFTVVVGNPPYSNFGQLNKIPFILGLLEDYKRGLDEKKINLDDDFIKFMCFSQHLLGRSAAGVLGLITNNVYLDGLTHRRMRQSLEESFERVRVLDLHGSRKRRERAPGGANDENVFDDITIGVGIGLFVRCLSSAKARVVAHSEMWGERRDKYAVLEKACVGDIAWRAIGATAPHYFFVPKDFDQRTEYERGFPVAEIFPVYSSGIQTKRDNVAVAESREVLVNTLRDFARLPPGEVRKRFALPADGRDWTISWASAHAKEILKSTGRIVRILYRPFDRRWTVSDSRSKGFVAYPRFEVMSQMRKGNLGLIVTRQLSLSTFQHVLVTRDLIDGNTISLQTREYNYLFPLYLNAEMETQRSIPSASVAKVNLSPPFLRALASGLSVPVGDRGLPVDLTPEGIFHYAYSVFHSPGYRRRYQEFLKVDFPRLPLPGSVDFLSELAGLGSALVEVHLLESPRVVEVMTDIVGGDHLEVERASWSSDTVWLDKAQTRGFRGVREEVWNFPIGGYQVCEKWLKDRKGRRLSKEDIEHYQKIVVAISETIRIMKEIDEVIEAHGGWPGAFQTGEARVQVAVSSALPFRPRTVEPAAEERYLRCVPLVPLKIAAGGFGEAQAALDEGTEWVEVASRHRLRPGMFVSQVSGRSMEPAIPDGAWCLFAAPVTGSRQGRVVLAQLRDATDPESGERYTVKRYESRKSESDEGWRHEAITLKPDNPEVPAIELEAGDEERLAVIAELLEVLTDSGSGEPSNAAAKETAEPPVRARTRAGWSRQPAQRSLLEGGGQLDLGETLGAPGPEAASGARPRADELDRDDLVCGLRALFGDGVSRSRDEAIRELARGLGFERTGPRIHEAVDNAIRAAVRRGVLDNERDQLTLNARSIDQYERAFLKEQFVAALEGKAWVDRAEAIRRFARWLGFRRTGRAIEEAGRSLINGLLREERLESDGPSIRRAR